MNALTLLVTADPSAPYLDRLARLPENTRVIVSNDRQRLHEAAPEADVILNGLFRDPALFLDTFQHATRVRWVHTLSAGVEHVLSPEMIASPVPMTSGRGVFRRPLGEWVIAAMLHFSYDLRRIVRNQGAERWEPFDVDELYGHTLGLIGYGEIGRTAAELARAFGMKVLFVRRNPDGSADSFPPARLDEMLGQCDYVALATPLTRETRGMIGASQIAAMKPSAVIINVGRGAVIDEGALIDALENGKIRGAALDVFVTEPLPAGHPFYRLENVLLSPHSADHTPGQRHRAVDLFLENFERFQKGEPLQNLVDKHAGY
jgi:phosphoglycerate dehydrogenase-like enzyme